MNRKCERLINMYSRLCRGEVLVLREEAERSGVDERSVQRDINDLRRIRVLYKGLSIETVLDRLPTAKVISHDENGFWSLRRFTGTVWICG